MCRFASKESDSWFGMKTIVNCQLSIFKKNHKL